MRDRDWDARYAAHGMLWGAEPNRFVAEAFGAREGDGARALDVACGEGRNAVWLARRGWRVTALDFSRVALGRGRALAGEPGVEVAFVRADATVLPLAPGRFALAVVAYLQLPRADRRRALAGTARSLAAGGELFGIAHARRNLAEGVGGPSDATVLWDPDELTADLEAAGLRVEALEEVRRPVETEQGPRDAIDLRLRARRPGS